MKKTTRTIRVRYKINKENLKIYISPDKEYSVNYPLKYLNRLSKKNKIILLNNYVYCKTAPLKISHPVLIYNFQQPHFFEMIDKSVILDIPRIARMSNLKINELESKYKRNQPQFQKNADSKKLYLKKGHNNDEFVLSFSFGKDSLLSYALLKELKVKFSLATFNIGLSNEKLVKNKIMKKFQLEEKLQINVIRDETDKILTDKKPDKKLANLDYTNGLLSFVFELIPIAFYKKSKFIVFGNQKDFDDYFIDRKTGERVYYSADQSDYYMNLENEIFKDFTNNNIQITSLIKPIFNICIYKLFAHKYRHLIQYILSCESGTASQWCGKCYICSEAYLFISAFTDPKILNFKKPPFSKEYADNYILFNKNKKNFQNIATKNMRDQELLAFLYAQRNGQSGDLISEFEKKYRKEAIRREKELKNRFFRVYKSKTVPQFLREKLFNLLESSLKLSS